MAFPNVIDAVGSGLGSTAATFSPTLSGSIVAGRLLVVNVVAGKPMTPSAGWGGLGSFVQATAASTVASYAAVAVGGGGDSLTLTFVGGNATAVAVAYQVDNWSGALLDIGWSGVDATLDAPSLTMLTGGDNLWLPGACNFSAAITGAPANYTDLIVQTGGAFRMGTARRALTATSEDPGAFTTASAFFPCAWTIGVAPAAAQSPPRPPYVVNQAAIQRTANW